MNDDLQLFDEVEQRSARNRRGAKAQRARARRRRRKRVITGVVVLAVLVLLAGGVWYGWRELRGIGDIADYAGTTGESDVVVEVADGATTAQIGTELARADVVASGAAFVRAAATNDAVRSVQPGFYRMRTKLSGAAAATLLTTAESRVGQLEIRGGTQLDDVALPNGDVVPGVISLVAKATCADLNGQSTCLTADVLREAMSAGDAAALGIPEWARAAVANAEPRRRLEGLIMPGVYNVKPGGTAPEVLQALLSSSMIRMQAAGMPGATEPTGFTPYEVLVIASLVEKEAINADFGKVARVVYNRLARPMPLQFDSTINYPLDRQEVRTTAEARATPGPYNTYLNNGLTPTPIAAVSAEAIQAAVNPEPGDWVYFVKCSTDGTSCFAATQEEHDANVARARAAGVF
ncbi:MAG TPA: endolytic transglycosylase MltG [Pseudonocardiaceae bacterium]